MQMFKKSFLLFLVILGLFISSFNISINNIIVVADDISSGQIIVGDIVVWEYGDVVNLNKNYIVQEVSYKYGKL